VIPAGFDYLQPTSVHEALEMMSLHPHARFLAGGHALLPESKLRHTRP
jgi:CO/xanthine dehydrogenase FAD-binding subunit